MVCGDSGGVQPDSILRYRSFNLVSYPLYFLCLPLLQIKTAQNMWIYIHHFLIVAEMSLTLTENTELQILGSVDQIVSFLLTVVTQKQYVSRGNSPGGETMLKDVSHPLYNLSNDAKVSLYSPEYKCDNAKPSRQISK